MSVFGLHLLTDAQYEALKAAGHEVAGIVLSDTQHAVALIKAKTDVGKTIAADIAAVKNDSLSALEKFEEVVKTTIPEVERLLAPGGVAEAVADVESIARELVQSVFNDVASTHAGTVAASLIQLVGAIA